MTTAPDIFLSYSREDQARAKLFADAFAAQGFSVWWDVGLRTGEAYDEVTEAALRNAKAVVVLWSKRSVMSRWVRAEATLADRNKTLVPVMIEACERPIMFELTQTAELSTWRGDPQDPAFRAFVEDLRGFVAKPATDARVSPPVQSALRRAWGSRLPAVDRRVLIAAGLGLTGIAGVAAWQGPWWAATTMPAAAVPGPAETGPPILAVLPFMTLTRKDEDIAFADGLHEDLLSRLANVRGLRVIARASVLGFANTNARLSAIASELGVGSIVTGSVQRDGSIVKVTVQLADARTETQLWGTSYERPLSTQNLFAIQRDLTQSIASQLGTLLTAEEMQAAFSGGTRSLEAYDAYALGLKEARDVKLLPAIESFRRATELDPSFSAAFSQIAVTAGQLHWLSNRTDMAMLALARSSIVRANALAPHAIETRHANAFLKYISGDFPAARRLLQPLLAEAPNNVGVLTTMSLTVRRLGDLATARSIGEKSVILDPISLSTQYNLVSTLYYMGAFAEAERRIENARQRWRSTRVMGLVESDLLLCLGDLRGAFGRIRDDEGDDDVIVTRMVFEKLLWLASSLRDATLIRGLMDKMPTYLPDAGRLHYPVDLYRAEAAYGMGQVSLAREIAGRMPSATITGPQDPSRGWGTYSLFTPAVAFGIAGDLVNLRRVAHDLDAMTIPDKLSEIWFHRVMLAIAFARAGDADGAMAQIHSMERVRGPCLFLMMSKLPDLVVLKTRPDWLALQRRYQDWARMQEPW